ncbi:MAG TPA: hypothetical protein VGR15_03065 [Bacteroidota bacterium]|jgi:hypothetical protein|nr:hypothetical protein [Bacteroidota bacterium]
MSSFGLAIAWEWEFDDDFICGIERECRSRDISTYQITPHNLPDVLLRIQRGELSFQAFYDRASDVDETFLALVRLLDQPSVRVINPHDRVRHAIDKATMHLEFITNGLQVPYTIILSPYRKNGGVEIPTVDFQQLGKPFVVKPANTTGGGTGVVLNARTLEAVIEARKLHPDDKYLLQQFIHPKDLDGKRAWFRVYYAFGETILCWWDDTTHEYTPLSDGDELRYGLPPLRTVMITIQRITQLDFFSSEIALTDEGTLVVVDYVNEICDMRLKSRFRNGAPDAVVHRIEFLIAREVESHVAKLHREKA